MWRQTSLTQRLEGLRHPIVLAPMAGVSTPQLVAAVSNTGGLGLYGAALTPPSAVQGLVTDIRSRLQDGAGPFGLNLFCPPPAVPPHTPQQAQALGEVQAYYAATAAQLGLGCGAQLGAQPFPDVAALHATFEAQVEAALDAQVPVLSFYFGIPTGSLLARVQAARVFTIGTATNKAEALALQDAGIDAIVAQGSEAGGHRGTWYTTPGPYQDSMASTTSLLAQLAPNIHVPLLGAGGIMTGQQLVAALAAGAAGVQCGTAFLACEEAGTSALGRQLLLTQPDRGTVVTQAFTGKPARGLVNTPARDLQQLQAHLPTTSYGTVNARPFFAAAAQAGLGEYGLQLCGQGYPACRMGSVAEVVGAMLAEADTEVAARRAAAVGGEEGPPGRSASEEEL